MAKKNTERFYQRLTRLFRSGPAIQRRTKGKSPKNYYASQLTQDMYGYQNPPSAGGFGREQSQGLMGQQGLLDRLTRYYEYIQMEQCLHEDTKIAVPGGYKTIKELSEEYNPEDEFVVCAFDHDSGHVIQATGRNARQTTFDHAYKVILDTGNEIIGSYDHPLMKQDGSYCAIKDLVVNDKLMSSYKTPERKVFHVPTVTSIEYYGLVPLYDLTVDYYKNFATDSVISHNSPEINSSLDIYGDEVAGSDEHGKSLHVFSEKPQIKKELEELFYDTLNTEYNLRPWARNLCQYGDLFLFVNVVPDDGVIHAQPIPVHEMERQEGFDPEDPYAVRYKWTERGNQYLENWQVAHFRLLGNDSFLPYGQSVLEGARRIWRILCLRYDTNIWTANGYKQIKDINAGDTVYSYDWNKHKTVPTKVKNVTPMGKQKLVEVHTSHRKIVTTPNHGLLVQDKNGEFYYKKSEDIELNIDSLVYPNFDDFESEAFYENVIDRIEVEEDETWDLEVDHELHNFVAEGVVSHNTMMEDAMLTYRVVRCLHGDTNVLTESGYKKIKDIEVGEKVYSYDEQHNQLVLSNVTDWVNNGEQQIWAVKSKNHFIKANENHPIYVFDQRTRSYEYVKVRNLIPTGRDPNGNKLIKDHHQLVKSTGELEDIVLVEPTDEYEEVYDIRTDNHFHNFIADGVIVHNSPERRVFYIDVGTINPEEVPSYMEQAKATIASNQVTDADTGRQDHRYNPLPVAKDTPIPLLDGRELTIEQLSEEHKKGNDHLWVYSIQDQTHKFVPGKVAWCGKNYTANRLIKVWLDDHTYVRTAPEHPFVMRDGSSKRADELKENDSIMPMYFKNSSKEDGMKIENYPMVYDPYSEKYKFVHRVVANDVLKNQREHVRKNTDWKKNKNLTVHHKDCNRKNSNPNNLEWMGNVDHFEHHAKTGRERLIAYNKSEAKRKKTAEDNRKYKKGQKMAEEYNNSELHKKHNEIRREAQKQSWKKDRQKRVASMTLNIPEECFDVLSKEISALKKSDQKKNISRETILEMFQTNPQILSLLRKANPAKSQKREFDEISRVPVERKLKQMGYSGFAEFRDSVVGYKNHKVLKVEEEHEPTDVYCMTIVGPNGEDDRHNFSVRNICTKNEKAQSFSVVVNSIEDDYWIPVRGNQGGTKIDTLSGGQHTTATEDVEFLQSKLFAALKVPKPYLNYDETVGSKATLSQTDIRFSRTISQIQKVIIAELNKLAMIHLYSKGFNNEDLVNFELKLSNPSTVALQQKLELWSNKFDIAGTAKDTELVDSRWIQKNILELTDDDIYRIQQGVREDKIREAELEAITFEERPETQATTVGTFDSSQYDVPGGDVPKQQQPGGDNSGNVDGSQGGGTDVIMNRGDQSVEDLKDKPKVSYKKGQPPIKATPFLTRHAHNRRRRVGMGGRENKAMPDFRRMLSQHDNSYNTDVYDSYFLQKPTKRESADQNTQPEEENEHLKSVFSDIAKDYYVKSDPMVSKEMKSIFTKFDVNFNRYNQYSKSNSNLLTETFIDQAFEESQQEEKKAEQDLQIDLWETYDFENMIAEVDRNYTSEKSDSDELSLINTISKDEKNSEPTGSLSEVVSEESDDQEKENEHNDDYENKTDEQPK